MAGARDSAASVVRALRDAGHVAYFAGGCVRDELLGLTPADYDVATSATPDEVRAAGRAANWSVNEVGVSFGVLLVTARGQTADNRHTVEVATFREEGAYSDKRRPDSVKFSTASADAGRRDFTINALFLAPLGDAPRETGATVTPAPLGGWVVDFVGGITDLRAKVLRAVGDARARLAEDHLRALRAVRIAARLSFEIEGGTREAITRDAASLTGVSRERIGGEVRRMLGRSSRARAAALLQDLGLDAPVLDEASNRAPLPTLSALEEPAGAMTALAAWALDRSAAARGAEIDARALAARWRAALCLSNDESADLRDALLGGGALVREWNGWGVAKRKRFGAGRSFAPSLQLLEASDPAAAARVRREVEALAAEAGGLAPAPLISGDDLAAAGFRPGPAFKQLLERLYDLQLEGRVATKADALAEARRMVG